MKYMGSKSRIAKQIVPIIQTYIDESETKLYIEPFVGGANIIDKISCERKIGCDANLPLIALLTHVALGNPLLDEVDKDLYDKVRGNPTDYAPWLVGNIGFLASFNGRYFDGGYAKTGIEKTKNGPKVRNYYLEAKNNLLNQKPYLTDTYFYHQDYLDIYVKNAVIYCDPPYANTKTYKSAKNFNTDEFWETMRLWAQHNIVLISEENAPDDFECIWEQSVSRTMNVTNKLLKTERLYIFKK